MPRIVYRLQDGTRVPGVTTILSRFKESGGLIHWAWNLGMEGKDYREERDAAADAGTMGHQLVEADIKGTVPAIKSAEAMKLTDEEWQTRYENGLRALEAYKTWKEGSRVEIIGSELPLVSERLRVGGCIDAVATINSELSLLDWKTSNRLYADYLIQIAAYREIWNENHPERLIESAHLVRFDKVYANFAHHYFGPEVLDEAVKAFRLMRELYDIDAFLKKAV